MKISELVEAYRTDKDSTYHELSYAVRIRRDRLLARISQAHGLRTLAKMKLRDLKRWHASWSVGGKASMGRDMMSCLRSVLVFGATVLESADCSRLLLSLESVDIKIDYKEYEVMTADHADAIRTHAHEIGWHSIGLAQALQFELPLSQKDVIGEWVPHSDPAPAYETWRDRKWIRGLRWCDIDTNNVMRRMTRHGRLLVYDLKRAPMIMDELTNFVGNVRLRDPCIICESNAMPYSASEFRRKWRIVANYAGVPITVKNTNSSRARYLTKRQVRDRRYAISSIFD